LHENCGNKNKNKYFKISRPDVQLCRSMPHRNPKKQRIDTLLVKRGLAPSRQRAQALIMAGRVRVDDRRVDKPGAQVPGGAHIHLAGDTAAYVSRGGTKLEAAIRGFALQPEGCVCLDVGASTGGFTDCLLRHGARHVYAVDVGYGQFAWKLRQDPRVTVIERTNIRYMTADAVPVPVDMAVVDVSFISLKIVVPAVSNFVKPDGRIVVLLKPQFEVGRQRVGKGGVVRDPAVHKEVVDELSDWFNGCGLVVVGVLPSPILGPKGNREFLLALLKQPG
jgi:23S rRNA (cytidine1920-2'-O)/16S rRNA (cytidine1409-2'-O)-methyltransferase